MPRRYRHDGWTPERQKAFIEALADTGCVTRAAGQVNMAQANCYALRRAPGAEEFRRAWDAALDFGVKRLKDIAFERAIEGQLVPVFVAGKLMGFRRKRNDALLMFCLRHYGQDANGKRTTINYFSTRASAGAAQTQDSPSTSSGRRPSTSSGRRPSTSSGRTGVAGAQAETSTTTVRTVINGSGPSASPGQADDEAAGVLNGFEGVALDPEAEAADDPGECFVRIGERSDPYRGELLPAVQVDEFVPFAEGEAPWTLAGAVREGFAPRDAVGDGEAKP